MKLGGHIITRRCLGTKVVCTVIADWVQPETENPADAEVVLSFQIHGVGAEFIRELLNGNQRNILLDIVSKV